MKKYTVLPSTSDVFAVSLVEDPAVESNFVALSKQQPMDFKIQDEERRMLYGVVLRADFPIYRRYGDEEFYLVFEKDAVRRLMTKFMKNFGQKSWTKDHMDFTDGITVVESWIVEDVENDKAKALGLSNYSEGSWMIGAKVDDDEMWQSIKDGRWKGFSIEALVDMEEMDFDKIKEQNNDQMKENKLKEIFEAIKSLVSPTETVEDVQLEEQKPEEEEVKPEEETVTEETVQEETVEEVDMQSQIDDLNTQLSALRNENEELKKANERLSKTPSTKVVQSNQGKTIGGVKGAFAALKAQGFIE